MLFLTRHLFQNWYVAALPVRLSLSSLAISLLLEFVLAFSRLIKASDISETFDFVGGGGL